MSIKHRFTYDELPVSSMVIDGFFLWVAFGNKLKKVDAFDPSAVYFDLTLSTDDIPNMEISGTNLYGSLDDDNYIATRITKANPLGNINYYTKPGTITEKAVDLAVDTYLYVLIPGEASGTNAKILKFSKTADTLVSTIDLASSAITIRNASSIAIKPSGNLWVVTNESPAKLIEVNVSTEDFEVWTIQ